MKAESPEPGASPGPPREEPGFVIKRAEVYVGEGGIGGGSVTDLSPVRLSCALCGYTEEEAVPMRRIRALRRQHERDVHPGVFQKRQELQRAIAELDQQLWGTELFRRDADT